MAARAKAREIEVDGHALRISSPDKPYFPELGITKSQVVDYYRAVAPVMLPSLTGRPILLKRHPDGAAGEFFYQKRAPDSRPDWVRTCTIHFPSGRSADHVIIDGAAPLAWAVQIGCIEIHAHPVREADLDQPDELRVDLDPGPGVPFEAVRAVATVVREVLDEHRLVGWPKTTGGRGIHIYVPIQPLRGFTEVRLAALAVAREVERRAPDLATSRWWKEERHGVFVDYNQNARDRTMATAYSLRANPEARASAPLAWDEVPTCSPSDFTLATVLERVAGGVDPWRDRESTTPGTLDSLLALAGDQERAGAGAAPLPPFHPKHGEAPLVIVARADREADARAGLERWKARHPEAAAHLEPADILVDSMRGASYTWTRIRVNLRHVPDALRPAAEPPDPDDVTR